MKDRNSLRKIYKIWTLSFGHEWAAESMEKAASDAAYEGSTDLGNTQPEDGPQFNGEGYHNYTRFSKAIGDFKVISQGIDGVAANYSMD
ncbi:MULTISPECIES: hypothetical protein [Bacillus]|uniref:hypothetical protein n=1 Tax=Bacillus TaxID=1386 RepID=UPI001581711E|nr:hypothetical protein [Bacillus glycinifermentans]MBU8785255.1 hypothetical protein [Bacillus glycinifermentans]NUJ15425.1 hypothetical protein [Bacillus glycinifermentans]